jgi:hypothetical protein
LRRLLIVILIIDFLIIDWILCGKVAACLCLLGSEEAATRLEVMSLRGLLFFFFFGLEK